MSPRSRRPLEPARPFKRPSLPAQPTAFIGRSDALAEIDRRLADPACRLLTLVGPGGIGKTRLALAVAEQRLRDFPDGVHFVSLAALSSPDAIAPAITSAFGLQLPRGGDPLHQLLAYLSDKKMLLVLDNYEHLRDGADLLVDLLEAAPGVMLLVTSREVLNLRAEWVHPVEGLHYPEEGAMDAPEGYDAVQLFVDRARRVQSGFSLAQEQAGVQRVCRLVEGMPLALELAATWLRTLSCEAIADEIVRGNGFLATTMRDAPARHRSMRAVFDHSWRLLADEERAAFARLSVCRGGFTRAAAETVAGVSLDLLRRLGDKSLIRFNPDGARYHVHELLRQYAAEQLEASGEDEAARVAHLRYFAAFMAARGIDIKGRRQRAGLDETEADFQNVRAAWEGGRAARPGRPRPDARRIVLVLPHPGPGAGGQGAVPPRGDGARAARG
ncbi:MAG: AAA family ATPase [Anaerolineae bacterium]|nr:AAA family ATPase [Anaerolineae bacterium]